MRPSGRRSIGKLSKLCLNNPLRFSTPTQALTLLFQRFNGTKALGFHPTKAIPAAVLCISLHTWISTKLAARRADALQNTKEHPSLRRPQSLRSRTSDSRDLLRAVWRIEQPFRPNECFVDEEWGTGGFGNVC